MSILVVSVSHKSTSVAHLGQLALDCRGDDQTRRSARQFRAHR